MTEPFEFIGAVPTLEKLLGMPLSVDAKDTIERSLVSAFDLGVMFARQMAVEGQTQATMIQTATLGVFLRVNEEAANRAMIEQAKAFENAATTPATSVVNEGGLPL